MLQHVPPFVVKIKVHARLAVSRQLSPEKPRRPIGTFHLFPWQSPPRVPPINVIRHSINYLYGHTCMHRYLPARPGKACGTNNLADQASRTSEQGYNIDLIGCPSRSTSPMDAGEEPNIALFFRFQLVSRRVRIER